MRKYFSSESKQHASELVKEIKNEFKNLLKRIDWMDEQTRQRAIDKADGISDHIGYPDELLDDGVLGQTFREVLVLLPRQIFVMAFRCILAESERIGLFTFNAQHQQIWCKLFLCKTETTRQQIRLVRTFHVGASERFLSSSRKQHKYYIKFSLIIFLVKFCVVLPAGILQGLFFNKDRPNYMNYGAIGSVIGHEITHGFDDTGRLFDKEGNLKEWWQMATRKAFLEKASCLINQYANFTVEEVNLKVSNLSVVPLGSF